MAQLCKNGSSNEFLKKSEGHNELGGIMKVINSFL